MFSNVIHSSVLNIPARLGYDFASQVPSLQIDCDLFSCTTCALNLVCPDTTWAVIVWWCDGPKTLLAPQTCSSWGFQSFHESWSWIWMASRAWWGINDVSPSHCQSIHQSDPKQTMISNRSTTNRAKWIESKSVQVEQNPLNICIYI